MSGKPSGYKNVNTTTYVVKNIPPKKLITNPNLPIFHHKISCHCPKA